MTPVLALTVILCPTLVAVFDIGVADPVTAGQWFPWFIVGAGVTIVNALGYYIGILLSPRVASNSARRLYALSFILGLASLVLVPVIPMITQRTVYAIDAVAVNIGLVTPMEGIIPHQASTILAVFGFFIGSGILGFVSVPVFPR